MLGKSTFYILEEFATPLDEDHWEYLPKQSFVAHLRDTMRFKDKEKGIHRLILTSEFDKHSTNFCLRLVLIERSRISLSSFSVPFLSSDPSVLAPVEPSLCLMRFKMEFKGSVNELRGQQTERKPGKEELPPTMSSMSLRIESAPVLYLSCG